MQLTEHPNIDFKRLVDDDYYYGAARKHALSQSNIGSILDGTFDPNDILNAGQQEEKDFNINFEIGSMFHVQTLEPHKMDQFTVVDVPRRAKGDRFLKTSEVEMCRKMKLSHDSNIDARGLLYGPGVQYEVPVMGVIEGVTFIGKIDCLNPMLKWCVDLKSTRRVNSFSDSVKKWYEPQIWIYWKLCGYPTAYVVTEKTDDPRTITSYPENFSYASGKAKTLEAISIIKSQYPEVYEAVKYE